MPDAPASPGWRRAALAVAAAATALTLFERASARLVRGGSFAPRTIGALWCVHAGVCLGALAVVALSAAMARRAPPARRGLVAGAAGAVLLAWPGWRLGRALASGDWISQQPWARAVAWGVPALVVAAALALGVIAGAALGRRWLAPVLVVAAAACCLLDARVLPGLYEPAHVALYLTAGALATLAALAYLYTAVVAPGLARAAGLAAAAVIAAPVVLLASGAGARTAIAEAPTPGLVLGRFARSSTSSRLLVEIDRATLAPGPATRGSASAARAPLARSAVIILVDTLRADALPPVRSSATAFAADGDTPALDAWLGSAVRFRRAQAQATQTARSVPPLFRSLEPFEDVGRSGTALPEAMKRAGIVPIAVVPQYFLMPVTPQTQELLHGFEQVEIYEKDHQEVLVDKVLGLVEAARDRRFFAWVHVYAMHEPYFAGRPLGDEVRGSPELYRAALRWVDGELGRLFAGLDRLGLSETTAVILAADHGEQLGEGGRRGHGGGVSREEIHVPLAMRIPGRKGAVVEGLVGNIDIVPTLFDVLGLPADPQHRGGTLLPLLDTPEAPSGRAYYAQSGDGSVHALVDERSKLVYREKQRVFLRYDARADPGDEHNLFGRSAAEDERRLSELVRQNPRLFADELRDPRVPERLARRLEGARVDGPSGALSFLLRVAEATPTPEVAGAAERLFQATADAEVRAEIAQRLFAADRPRWSRLLDRWVREVAGRPEEIEAVRALARRGQAEFSAPTAAARIGESCATPSAPCEPWLALTLDWDKAPALFARPLLAALRAPAPEAVLIATLSSAARFPEPSGRPDPALEGFEDALLPFAGDPRVLVASAAWRALGRTGGDHARAAARAASRDLARDPRVRQAALQALASLSGAGALDDVIAAGGDPLLTADAITILARLRDHRGLPFLERTEREHGNAWTRGQAKAAAAAVRASPEAGVEARPHPR